jgi:hypothetical protein
MIKTDKMLRKYVTALLKYYEDSKVFNPDFTAQEIPKIFNGWAEIDFNMVHHGAGIGCCTCIGPGRYQINVGHCNALQTKFTDSDRTKWRLIVAIIALTIMLIGTVVAILKYANEHHQGPQYTKENNNLNRH